MPKDENKMGKWGATSYIIGNIVGSGIFITPASVLNNSSSVGVALLIWLVSAIIAILGAFCYVELGTSIRRSGGDYAYLNQIAFAFMLCACIMTTPLTLAIQAETFSEYFIRGLDIQLCGPWKIIAQKLIGFSVVWILLYLNFFSIRTIVARFQIVASGVKFLSTGIIIAIGIYYLIFIDGSTKNLMTPFEGTKLVVPNLANAFFAGLFSYDGWDVLNFGAEDLKNPKLALPFAIIVGMSSVTLLFLAINISYFVVLSIPQIHSTSAIATTFAKESLGNFQYIIPFFISIVLIGNLNVTVFMASRYLFAAARSRQFPAFFSCMNTENDSPRAALFIHVLLAFVLSFIGNLEDLINYVTFALFIQRVLTIIALLYIRILNVPVHPEAIQMPLIIPITYLLLTGALIGTTIVLDFKTAFVSLLLIFIGLIFYVLFLWDKSLQRFEIYRRFVDYFNNATCTIAQMVFNGDIHLDSSVDEEAESAIIEMNKVEGPITITNKPSIQTNPQIPSLIKQRKNQIFVKEK